MNGAALPPDRPALGAYGRDGQPYAAPSPLYFAENGATGVRTHGMHTKPLAEVEDESIEWLWDGWLLTKGLHVVAALPSVGKTHLVTRLLADLTTGRPLPGELLPHAHEQLRVGIMTLEEHSDSLHKARFTHAGGDLSMVELIESRYIRQGEEVRRAWKMPDDVDELGAVIRASGLSVVMIDGIGYSMSGGKDGYGDVGDALSALGDMAHRTGVAIIGITHLPKSTANATVGAIGSIGWSAIPRILWVLGLDPDDDEPDPQLRRRVARVAKTNYKPPHSGLSFRLEGSPNDEQIGIVTDIRASTVAADALIQPVETSADKSDAQQVREYIRDLLPHSGDSMEYRDLRTKIADSFPGPCSSYKSIATAIRKTGMKVDKPTQKGGSRRVTHP
jgi:hypothetical protein